MEYNVLERESEIPQLSRSVVPTCGN